MEIYQINFANNTTLKIPTAMTGNHNYSTQIIIAFLMHELFTMNKSEINLKI